MPEITQEEVLEAWKQAQAKMAALPEPHLHLVPSIVFQGYRWRSIYSTLHYRPLTETFDEFILKRAFHFYGDEWKKQEEALPEPDRHVFMRWVDAFFKWKSTTQTDENKVDEHTWHAKPSGDVKALQQFAYDLYCLEAVNRLPDFLIQRIKNKNEFQGARYEIAVAATMARAGFEITFLDDVERSKRHCEFIAKNKITGEEVGVEAKSRRRKGVLNEKGASEYSDLVKGDIYSVFKKARSQKPDGIPYLIFIDLNVLPSPGVPLDKKTWLPDVKAMLDLYPKSTKESPDPFSVLYLTNFSFYYAGESEGYADEFSAIVPPFPEYPLKKASFDEIWASLDRYSHIPKEV